MDHVARTTRPTIVALSALLLLVLLPGTALAHASFDVTQLPAGAEQELVLRVPLERDAANELVEVLVPGAFGVVGCDGADGWTCEQDETQDGDTVLTLERAPDGPGETERFDLTVAAPQEEGVYAFPTIQTYDDGQEVSWLGAEGSDNPAPRLQVGDETTEVEFSGDATPHTEAAPDDPSTDATDTPETTPDATTPEPSPPPASPDAQATTGPTDDGAETDPEAAPEVSDDTDADVPVMEGGPSTTVLVVGAALLIAFAIAVGVARRRT